MRHIQITVFLIISLFVMTSAMTVFSKPVYGDEVTYVFTKRTYTWYFMGEKYTLNLEVKNSTENKVYRENGEWVINLTLPQDAYAFYKKFPGGFRIASNYSFLNYFITPDDRYIKTLAADLNYIAEVRGFDTLEKANFVLSFVQSMEYMDDLNSTGFIDYYKFPLETLVDGGGDCEDTSLLLITLLDDLNYSAVLFVMKIKLLLEVAGHVAVGVNISAPVPDDSFTKYLKFSVLYNGSRYYYMETTTNASRVSYFEDVHYWVGVSPTEAGADILNLTVIPQSNYHYHGFGGFGNYVREVSQSEEFPWFGVILGILMTVYIPLFIISLKNERKRCPRCRNVAEDWYHYCPHCGYWLGYGLPPPPPPPII